MSEAGPWLVLGGAAVVIACVVAVLVLVVRVLRARRVDAEDGTALTALEEALSAPTPDDDTLMPLLLAAAISVSGADAAALSFVAPSGRRRSYSANFEAATARQVIEELLEAEVPAEGRERVVVPIASRSGALAVYWLDEAPSERDGIAAELERLVATTFRARAESPERMQRAEPQTGEWWSRIADLNATLELEPLLRKVLETAVAESAADGAAASVRDAAADGPVAETMQLDDHERDWVDPILRAETVVPSITRYVGAQSPPDAGIATTIVVPLRDADGEAIGSLVAVWRRDIGDEVDARLADLEALADHARVAIDNAVRFRRIQIVAVRDPVSGIFDQRYFLGALSDACDVAQEQSKPLLLVALSAVDVTAAAHDVDLAALETSLAETAARIAEVVGDGGVTCRVALGTFAAIVPSLTLATGRRLLDRLAEVLTETEDGDPIVRWQLGAVERKRYEQADALWVRAVGELGPLGQESERTATAG